MRLHKFKDVDAFVALESRERNLSYRPTNQPEILRRFSPPGSNPLEFT